MFSSTELHLCFAGGECWWSVCLCCPTVQDSDLVMLWEASPSQWLAVIAGVPTSPWGGMREVLLAQGTAASLGVPVGKMAAFLMLGSLFGCSGFVFPSQPARKAFLSYSRSLAGLWAWWAGCPLQN